MKTNLDAARAALEHGHAKRALRIAWNAAISSSSGNDGTDLEPVIDLAEAIRDRSEGHIRDDAAALLNFCVHARNHRGPRRLLGLALGQEPRAVSGSREQRDVCPECASTVDRGVRFCSFCGASLASPGGS